MKYTSQKAVIENLKDAGCSAETIARFVDYFDCGAVERQLGLLSQHRDRLLARIHKNEKRIACLDYLIYQIRQGAEANFRRNHDENNPKPEL